MNQQALTITQTPGAALIPPDVDKHTKYRLRKFIGWLGDRNWLAPDLAAYRDHLLENYAASTVSAHLSTVRARYAAVLRDNGLRDILYRNVPENCETPADQAAFVDEVITRLENATDPANSAVKTKTIQDRPDSDHLRLTQAQAESLMNSPDPTTLRGLRDRAVIGLLLCCGLREAELVALDVADLRQRKEGELGLLVREGKGCKQRMVFYGELSWALPLFIEPWLQAAAITEGAVFRSFWKGGALRGRLSKRAVQNIIASYPIAIGGKMVKVRVHDCRRTYAKRWYDSGGDPLALKENMGHEDLQTTLGYIGTQDVSRRRAPAMYNPPALAQLELT
jgi:site-specific recombinase XerD